MNTSEMPETVYEFLDDLNLGSDHQMNSYRLQQLGVMRRCNRDGTEFVDTDRLEETLSDYYELDERLGTVYGIMVNSGFSIEHIDYPELCQYCGSGKARGTIKDRILRIITLTPWSRGDGNFCFGLKIMDAQHIAEELENIGQSSITVRSNLPDDTPGLLTKCNITQTFTTTCTHFGNIEIARFIRKHGENKIYGTVLIVDDKGLAIRIDNKSFDLNKTSEPKQKTQSSYHNSKRATSLSLIRAIHNDVETREIS